MKKSVQYVIIFIVFIASLITCVGGAFLLTDNKHKENPSSTSNSNPTEPETTATDPALYQICDSDSCIYVLGTIHVGDDRLNGLTEKIWKAYEESDALALEIDILKSLETANISSYLLPAGKSLKDYFTEEEYAKIATFCANHSLSADAFSMFNLSGAYQMISSLAYVDAGLDSNLGVDMQLAKRASTDGKKLIEMESIEFQEELLSSFPDEFYIQVILEMIESYDLQKEYIKEMYDTYLKGDPDALKGYLVDTDEDNEYASEYNEKMYYSRNAAMSEKAEQFLASNQKVIIAVGAAHVIGEKGIVDTLKDKGYQVQLVK